MSFRHTLENKQEEFEALLCSYLPKAKDSSLLSNAMKYPLTNGGKRLRPIFMQAIFEMYGGHDEKILRAFMVAIECIHCFSLVHDDLPSMDNDSLRRGKPTTHIVYGEDMGILVGDALLNYAYEIMLSELVDSMDPVVVGKAMQVISVATGYRGMIAGQVIDTKQILSTEEEVINMYSLKTGALIKASMEVGAILANTDESELKIITKVANKIGIAFQLQDDLLDIIGDISLTGKHSGQDSANDKKTLGIIYGIDKSREVVAKLTDEAIELLDGLDRDTLFIRRLINSLVNREY